jgi:hypothetical protein
MRGGFGCVSTHSVVYGGGALGVGGQNEGAESPRLDRVRPSQNQPLTATRVYPFLLRAHSKTAADHDSKDVTPMRHDL